MSNKDNNEKFRFNLLNNISKIERTYFKNGCLKSEGEYVNGLKEGIHREWFKTESFENKKLKSEGKFRNGKPIDTHILFMEVENNSSLNKTEGNNNTIEKSISLIKFSSQYLDGKLITSTEYFENGNKKLRKNYTPTREVKSIDRWDEDGHFIGTTLMNINLNQERDFNSLFISKKETKKEKRERGKYWITEKKKKEILFRKIFFFLLIFVFAMLYFMTF